MRMADGGRSEREISSAAWFPGQAVFSGGAPPVDAARTSLLPTTRITRSPMNQRCLILVGALSATLLASAQDPGAYTITDRSRHYCIWERSEIAKGRLLFRHRHPRILRRSPPMRQAQN